MLEIENEFLKVKIDLHGGTLFSVWDKKSGRELLWQGAEDSWTSRDVVIFPFIARLKNKTFTHGGRSYALDNHGLARYNDFSVVETQADRATLGFYSMSATMEKYPFDFALYVTYVLKDRALSVTMRVENRGSDTLYFGAGFHPAYNIDCTRGDDLDDISGNSVVFDGVQTLKRYVLDANGSFITQVRAEVLHEIPLDKQLFASEKTLIYGGVTGDIVLKLRSGNSIVYDMGSAPYTAIWSYEKRGGFVCIEPWWGLPDFLDCDSEIKNKTGINALEGGKTFECGYKVKYIFGGEDNDN